LCLGMLHLYSNILIIYRVIYQNILKQIFTNHYDNNKESKTIINNHKTLLINKPNYRNN